MKLYTKQEEILSQINKKGMILPLGTSTGKTLIALEWASKKYPNEMIYIFTPTAKCNEGGWGREIQNNYPSLKYQVIPYTQLNKYNYNQGVFILDECHYIKNSQSQRGKNTKIILKNNAKDFIMLSATPGTKVEDYANYFILWGLLKNKTEFYKAFIVQNLNMWGYMEIKGYKNLKHFNKIIRTYSTDVITVDDLVELPPIINKNVEFVVSKEYKHILKSRFYEGIPLDTSIKLCSTLRQHTNIKDKQEYLRYILTSTTDNIVIFYNFKSELDKIKECITQDKIVYEINGNNKQYPKKENFNKVFNSVTLVQIQSGGTGIELTYANQVIYFSPTYSYQDYEQSMGRCYRIGQNKKIIVYKFTVKGSIEEDIWDCLNKKGDFIEKLWIQ